MSREVVRWRTLIVDDEPLAREGIRTRLEALGGFDVIGECGSARAAVTAIRARAPDLVFLDVQMPVMDGFCRDRRGRGRGHAGDGVRHGA